MKKRSGFTLVELIATMAIMSIAVGTITGVFSSMSKISDIAGARYDNVQGLKIAEAYLSNDIRKSLGTEIPEKDSATGRNIFPGTDNNIANCNSYCEGKGYSELIYIKKIDDSICCYAYEEYKNILHKITIPVNAPTDGVVTEAKYYPMSYALNNLNSVGDASNQKWYFQDEGDIPSIIADLNNTIIDQNLVVFNNIKIEYFYDGINRTIVYDKFDFVYAYTDNDNINWVILKSQEVGPDNTTYPYFKVKLNSKQISYADGTQDKIIAGGIAKDGAGSPITVIPNTTEDIISGKYYEIHIDGKIGKTYNSVDTRVSLVNYTINWGI